MLNIRELREKAFPTKEEQIILLLDKNRGSMEISDMKNFSRSDILIHARKSPFLDYDRQRGVVKIVLKGKDHPSILDDWREAKTIEQFVMSLLNEDLEMSKAEILLLIEERCNNLGIDLTEFKRSNSNFNWYKKIVKKYKKAKE
jgi:hypothetical protein